MLNIIYSVSSLFLGIALLLMGLALSSTAMGIRAVAEGYSDTVTGFIMASYFGGFVLGSYYCPGLIRRVGPIRSFAVFAALASAASFLPTVLVHPLIWSGLRFVTGVCLVGLYMVLESWLNSLAPNEKRAQIFAVYMIVTLGSHALGQFLLLFDPLAQADAFGIAAVFFCLGLVPVALTRQPEPQSISKPVLHLKQIYQLSPLSVTGALAGGLATSSFWALGAVYASRSGMSGVQIVQFMVATILGGVVLQWPIGRISDQMDRRRVLLGVSVLAILVSTLAILTAQKNLLWLDVLAFFLGGMILPIYSLSVAHLNDRISTENALDASRGLLLMFGIGAFIGPIVAGVTMRQLGPVGLFYYVAAILILFVAFTLLRIKSSQAVEEKDRSRFVHLTRTSSVVMEMDPRVDNDIHTTEVNRLRE